MACCCQNEDGTLSKICRGTCGSMPFIEAAQQSRDPMNGFMELVLSQVSKMVENRMDKLRIEFEKEQMSLYKKAFMEGIREGIELKRYFREDY